MDNYIIWFNIFEHLKLKSKIALICTNSIFKNNLSITDLYNIEDIYLDRLRQNIIESDIFCNVTQLKARHKIYNVSFLRNLKILDASCHPNHRQICRIDQDGIQGLDLVCLDASFNNRITDVSFMTNLKALYVCSECDYNLGDQFFFSDIDQNGIRGLDLEVFYANDNKKIIDVSFMKNLKHLSAGCLCGLDQNSIKELDLYQLHVAENNKITDISFMKNLKKVNIRHNVIINQNSIQNLNLIELNVSNNPNIRDVSFMTNLKKLHAGYRSGIDQNGISGLKLYDFNIENNPNILDVSFMSSLKILNISCGSRVNDDGIKGLDLIILDSWGNENITKKGVYAMKNLRIHRHWTNI